MATVEMSVGKMPYTQVEQRLLAALAYMPCGSRAACLHTDSDSNDTQQDCRAEVKFTKFVRQVNLPRPKYTLAI